MESNLTEHHESHNDNQRVVVTGMSAITPVGNTVQETWEALKEGRSGAGKITKMDVTKYPCKVAGEIKNFEPEEFIPRKRMRHMAFGTQLAVVAAKQCIEDGDLPLDELDRDRIGVVIGTAGGAGVEETEGATRLLDEEDGSNRLSPFQILRIWPNMPSFFVADSLKIRGESLTICTACAASTQAIGEAAKFIRHGEAEVMLTGGTESMISEVVMAGFTAMRALPTNYNDDPTRAMRPFNLDREGFIPAQGSGMLLLESLEHAQNRGAHIYAELLGAGSSNDAFHMIAPDPEGAGAALAMSRALKNSGVELDQVDYINAHGTSTPLGDLSETKAIKSVFGDRAYDIPVSSSKSMIGHMMGATGAIEAMACIKSINEGIIHPTINYENPDPECDLDYVPNNAREAEVNVAMTNSFGLGGQNAVLVFGKMDGSV